MVRSSVLLKCGLLTMFGLILAELCIVRRPGFFVFLKEIYKVVHPPKKYCLITLTGKNSGICITKTAGYWFWFGYFCPFTAGFCGLMIIAVPILILCNLKIETFAMW